MDDGAACWGRMAPRRPLAGTERRRSELGQDGPAVWSLGRRTELEFASPPACRPSDEDHETAFRFRSAQRIRPASP